MVSITGAVIVQRSLIISSVLLPVLFFQSVCAQSLVSIIFNANFFVHMIAYKRFNFINMWVQVEQLVDQALKHNFGALEEFLLNETRDEVSSECSKEFMSKLDKLINRVGMYVFVCVCG